MRHGRRPALEHDAHGAATAWPDLAVLGAATVALRLPAFVASAHLTFDDGVYGASAVAMRAGGQPYRDVFSSQGPLFLPLVWLADVLGLRTTNAPRLLSLAAALLLVGATYLAGRAITDRGGALLAAGLVSATTTSLWITGPIAADGAALALRHRHHRHDAAWRDEVTVRRAVWIGLGVGATVSVKALLVPVVIPVAIVLLAGRRLAPIAAGAATAVGFHLLLWLPWGVGDVWDQSYGYHLEVAVRPHARAPTSPRSSARWATATAIVLVAAALAVGAVAPAPPSAPRRVPRTRLSLSPTCSSARGSARRSCRPAHGAPDVATARVAARPGAGAARRPPSPGVAGARRRRRGRPPLLPRPRVGGAPPRPVRGLRRRGASTGCDELPDGALAISDEPGLVWRSGRRTAARPRRRLDAPHRDRRHHERVARPRSAARPDVCAVVVTSGARWGSFDDLPDRLADVGYELAAADGDVRRVYVKTRLRPGLTDPPTVVLGRFIGRCAR